MAGTVPARGARCCAPTDTGTTGDWWSVFALVPDELQHAVDGFLLSRSTARTLPPVLRELAQARVGRASGSTFVHSQHCTSLRGLGVDDATIAAVPSWTVSDRFDPLQRAVLGDADALALDADTWRPTTWTSPARDRRPERFDAQAFIQVGSDGPAPDDQAG